MRLCLLLSVLALACAPPTETSRTSGTVEIHHFALGQADATLVVGPTGRTLLVDTGETSWDDDAGARRIGAYAREVLGRARFDTVVLTHFHLDHTGAIGAGGLWHLVEKQGFSVGRLIVRDAAAHAGKPGAPAAGWATYLASERGARLHPELARAGSRIDLGPGVDARVVAADGAGALLVGRHEDTAYPPNEDDYSIVLRLRFGAFDYVAGGDLSGHHAFGEGGYAYHDVERHVAPLVGDVDVYRVNHHGSAHASNPTWLAQLAPRVAVVSVGENNRHGHPHPSTVARITNAGARLYLTSRGSARTRLPPDARAIGDVVIRTDGRSFDVAGDSYPATDPPRVDADSDGYFAEADPDDADARLLPAPYGGCDRAFERCP
jgi:beta-lactamase superfamily II metal-dependent hydrolase